MPERARAIRHDGGLVCGHVIRVKPSNPVARRGKFCDGPAATGPKLNGRWEFYPISAGLITAI
jgi:hypothetical protein